MSYRYVTEKEDYVDFASGRLFYGVPTHPAFPVRLISEIFQRALAQRQAMGFEQPVVLYDPCCGGAYHLATLAYKHWEMIDTIIASDIDVEILPTTRRNLDLLSLAGLNERMAQIDSLYQIYGKRSHADALASGRRFEAQLNENLRKHAIQTETFEADGTNPQHMRAGLKPHVPDIVLADVPYGNQSNWTTSNMNGAENRDHAPLTDMLDALLQVISEQTIVVIIADKGQKPKHSGYTRVEQFQIGKRRISLLKKL